MGINYTAVHKFFTTDGEDLLISYIGLINVGVQVIVVDELYRFYFHICTGSLISCHLACVEQMILL